MARIILPTGEVIDPSRHIKEGLVTANHHPTFPLKIFNYTDRCNRWDHVTNVCRGLITDLDGNVVERCLEKFFDHGTEEVHPKARAFDKLDGSLGILYRWGGRFYMTTRGSFVSPQAKIGNRILEKMDLRDVFDEAYTYHFEIISPKNKIIVVYNEEKLVFLGARHIRDGTVHLPEEFPSVLHLFEAAQEIEDFRVSRDDSEGVVLYSPQAEGSYSLSKVKYEWYLKASRRPLSEYVVWRHLQNGSHYKSKDPEVQKWVIEVEERLNDRFREIKEASLEVMKNLPPDQDASSYIRNTGVHIPVCFILLKNKDPSQAIWKEIRPE